MAPSPEFAIRPGIGINVSERDKGKEKYRREMGKRYHDFLEGCGLGFPHDIFSDELLLRTFEDKDFNRYLKNTGIPGDRIIGGLIIPQIFDVGEISWRKAFEIAIRRKLEEVKNPKEIKVDKVVNKLLRSLGIEKIMMGEDGHWDVDLNLKRKIDGKNGIVAVYLSYTFSEEEKVADLTAIAMVPAETLRALKDFILVYPEKEGYRSLLILRLVGERGELRVMECDLDLARQEGGGYWVYALDFLKQC